MTVEELQEQGYKVKFRHKRAWVREYPIEVPTVVVETIGRFLHNKEELDKLKIPVLYKLAARGGETVCYIERDGELVAQGFASCSDLDHYNKAVGRTKAFGRAVSELQKNLSTAAS